MYYNSSDRVATATDHKDLRYRGHRGQERSSRSRGSRQHSKLAASARRLHPHVRRMMLDHARVPNRRRAGDRASEVGKERDGHVNLTRSSHARLRPHPPLQGLHAPMGPLPLPRRTGTDTLAAATARSVHYHALVCTWSDVSHRLFLVPTSPTYLREAATTSPRRWAPSKSPYTYLHAGSWSGPRCSGMTTRTVWVASVCGRV